MSSYALSTGSTQGQIPPELRRSIPREVRLTLAGKLAAATVAALLAGALVGGILLYWAAARDAARRQSLQSQGVLTQGSVIRVGRTPGDQPKRVVFFRYSIGGQNYEGRSVLERLDHRSFPAGSPLPVRYLPSDPHMSWMPGYEPQGTPMWLVAVLAAGLAFPAGLISWRLRRESALLAEGRPAVARVTHSKRIRQDKRRTYRIFYTFTILSGAERAGHCDVNKNPPVDGSLLTILYDREEPRRSALYPLPLVRVA